MAFYRDLQIESKVYQYHIGRDFVKIKNHKDSRIKGNSFPIELISPKTRGLVHPGMIKNFILGIDNKPENFFSDCGCKNKEKYIACLPFDLEIHDKKHYVYYCDDCLDANGWDI